MSMKKRKILCVLIIFMIFVSGMYFENIETYSVFACNPATAVNSYITVANPVITDAQACTTEMLGIRESIVTLQRFVGQKRDSKISLDFLYQNLFSLKEGKSYTGLKEVKHTLNSQNELVANYLHKTDGKKRI